MKQRQKSAWARPRVVFLDHTAKLSGGELALLRMITAAVDQIEAHVILAEDGPLAERLRTEGISVEVLAMDDRARGLRKDNVSMGHVPAGVLFGTSSYTLRLARRLREIRPDLVHSNSLKSGIYGALAAQLAGVPLIWHLRDRLSDDYLSRQAQRLVRFMARHYAELVICNSQSTCSTLAGHGRSVVIPSIAAPFLSPTTDRDDQTTLTIGLVGRIAPWKGQDLFLQAFAQAFPSGDARAVIVGAPLFGADEEAFERKLHELAYGLGLEDRVEFRGHRDDMAAELSSFDVLVHASTVPEPFGQVIVEGMAAGLPVIAARAGGPEEIITHGHDGLLYPMGDQASLAHALRRVATDEKLRRGLGAAARETAESFAPDRVVTRLLAAYRFAMGQRESPEPLASPASADIQESDLADRLISVPPAR